jgi:hypothetical protein
VFTRSGIESGQVVNAHYILLDLIVSNGFWTVLPGTIVGPGRQLTALSVIPHKGHAVAAGIRDTVDVDAYNGTG